MRDQQFWPYTAGFFDGEGCISVHPLLRRGYVKGIQVTCHIYQKKPAVLFFIQNELNRRSIKNSVYAGKQCYTLNIGKRSAQIAFLRKIRIYSVVKAQEIDYLLYELLPYFLANNTNFNRIFHRKTGTERKRVKLNTIELMKRIDTFRGMKHNRGSTVNTNTVRRLLGFKTR